MENHQILRPRQLRGTPSRRIFGKLGIALSAFTLLGFWFSDYLRGERQEKRIQAGYFLLDDHIRYHNFIMGQMTVTSLYSSDTLRKKHAEQEHLGLIAESNMKPTVGEN